MAAASFQFGATAQQPSLSGSSAFALGGGTSTGVGGSSFGSTATGGTGFTTIKPVGTTSTASMPFQFGNVGAAGSSTTPSAAFNFGAAAAAKTTASAFSGLASQSTSTPLLSALSQSAAKSTSGFTIPSSASTMQGSSLATLGSGLKAGSTGIPLGQSLAATGLTTGTSFSLSTAFGAPKTSAITGTTATSGISGLGGTGTSTSVTTTGTVTGVAGKQVDVKDTSLPGPLNEIAEHIKKYVKEQKAHRDEISRMSVSALEKVREETASFRQTLALVSNSIQRDGCAVENLKMDTAQELKNAEITQRTHDIPPVLQHENIAPQEYFQRLVESFEERMQVYRKHIEVMESHLTSLSQGQTLTPQDLSEVMRKVHETFIALAAQLHSIHDAVKVQKEHYLNYRKAYFKDTNDVFDAKQKNGSKSMAELGLGPSPFRTLSSTVAASMNISAGHQGVGFQSTDLGAAAGSRTMGLGTSMGIGSGLGASTQGTTGFANLGSTSGGFGTSSGFGTTLGTPARIGTGLGASAFGQTSGTSTGLSFGSSTSTGLGGGLNTGAATPSTFGTQPKFQLQRPPQGNKRGKRR